MDLILLSVSAALYALGDDSPATATKVAAYSTHDAADPAVIAEWCERSAVGARRYTLIIDVTVKTPRGAMCGTSITLVRNGYCSQWEVHDLLCEALGHALRSVLF